MAGLMRSLVYQQILSDGILPIFSHANPEVVVEVASAVARGGAKLFEFTNRHPGSYETFLKLRAIADKRGQELILGVGSLVDSGSVAQFLNAGADFVVSPSLCREVVLSCNRRKRAVLPGCLTPTEIGAAEELGCEIVKYFPADPASGPAFVKALRGPAPWTALLPTGGIEPTAEALRTWFDAGAVAVGLGSALFPAKLLEKADYDGIAARVAETLRLVKELRSRGK